MRIAKVMAMVAAVVFGSAIPASADHDIDNIYETGNADWFCQSWGHDGRPNGALYCRSDNSTVTYHANSSIGDIGFANILQSVERYGIYTDLSQSYQDPGIYVGDGQTDIIFRQGEFPGDPLVIGAAWCDKKSNGANRRCDQHYAQFKYPNPDQDVAMHVTGHTVGLTHGYDASPRIPSDDDRLYCMKTPRDGSINLGPLNIHNINVTY